MGLIPDWGTKVPSATQKGQKKTQKQKHLKLQHLNPDNVVVIINIYIQGRWHCISYTTFYKNTNQGLQDVHYTIIYNSNQNLQH